MLGVLAAHHDQVRPDQDRAFSLLCRSPPRGLKLSDSFSCYRRPQRARPRWGEPSNVAQVSRLRSGAYRPRVSNSTTSTTAPLIANPAKWNIRPETKKSSM